MLLADVIGNPLYLLRAEPSLLHLLQVPTGRRGTIEQVGHGAMKEGDMVCAGGFSREAAPEVVARSPQDLATGILDRT